ncbi:hypothetical protein MG292_09530 [Flavobacterium keumense]|uniref:Lipoprotein n=2 Tax=Flavobacteriaceae TaxID=49546 RepID=A0ABY8N7U2_9FLAO|nr:hypothetical protein [Flavobacterium keumense]WGK95724.1 hypothetical protein MG292_09530 [Flavobacterium keumense]
MKKITLLFSFLVFITSCALKHTQELVHSGDYDNAITIAVSSLESNKDKKSKQDYVYLLEEAFAKAKERDLNTLNLLEKENNPAQIEHIYQLYVGLNNRQEKIKPLLPLQLLKENRTAVFAFENYNDKLVTAKNALSNYLYANAKALLKSTNKIDFRKAFDDFTYLNQINPNFKDVNELLKEAKFKGSDFVLVSTKNETNMIIPVRLQNDLLDFNTYGLNDKWTVYHNTEQDGIRYDFGVRIRFREVVISPEQIKEKEFIKERRIKDGQKKLIDANGKEVLDEKGKVVFVDNWKDVTVKVNEFRQFKSCIITAKVDFSNWTTNQLLQSFPLSSEFIFENVYANYKGDRRAADDSYFPNFNKKTIPFPSNEQMIYDAGEDLKNKLKGILNQNPLRN